MGIPVELCVVSLVIVSELVGFGVGISVGIIVLDTLVVCAAFAGG